MVSEWFRRMGDIPELNYEAPVRIDRAALPGYDKDPQVHRVELGGRVRESLSWGWVPVNPEALGEGESESALRDARAPVREHVRVDEEEPPSPTEQLLQRLWEGLELPGRGLDYHWAIQAVCGQLRSRMCEEPSVLPHVESLACLDVRLVIAYPQAVTHELPDGKDIYSGVSAFATLIEMYSTEGFLNEALEVARLGQRFDQQEAQMTALEARLETIRGEDVGEEPD
jgi:hypothetical protein